MAPHLSRSFFFLILGFLSCCCAIPVSPEWTLFQATGDGNLSEVKTILRENPVLNVNWQWQGRQHLSALHLACESWYHVKCVQVSQEEAEKKSFVCPECQKTGIKLV